MKSIKYLIAFICLLSVQVMKAQKGIVDNTNIDQAMRTRMDIQPDEMPSQSISQKPIEDVSEMSLEAKPVSSVQSTMHIANSRN